MPVAAFVALILQQTAPGAVVWDAPPPLGSITEAPTAVAGTPTLPGWALADPFAWERSQCSALVRRDDSLRACQVRVRAELSANLGDALPPALRPTGLESDCVPTETGDDGAYAVTCAPQRRDAPVSQGLQERVCENRPQRQSNGAVTWVESCRPTAGEQGRDGLSLRLFGRD